MVQKMEIGEHVQEDGQNEVKEKIENALCTLQELKDRIAELKRRCEELRRLESERIKIIAKNTHVCDECRHLLNPEEQVIVRDSNGEERRHYHQECFQALFK